MMHTFSSHLLFPHERDELPKEIASFVRYLGPIKQAEFWEDCHWPPNPVPLLFLLVSFGPYHNLAVCWEWMEMRIWVIVTIYNTQ